MAHGDKKWIVDFSGKWKKSSDRTKKDYYAGLRNWDAWQMRYTRYGKKVRNENFCPQCRFYAKPIEEERARIAAVNESIHQAFVKQYPKYSDEVKAVARREAIFWKDFFPSSWTEYIKRQHEMRDKQYRDYEEFQKHYPIKKEYIWDYDIRSYLCEKHQNWYEKEAESWQYGRHGQCCGRTEARRRELQKYRSEVRNAMQKARYGDEDGYDDIPGYKRNWLD